MVAFSFFRRSKYNNRIVNVDGYRFASLKEANRYGLLKAAAQNGKISRLEIHPRFILQEKFRDNLGTKHRAMYYEADFKYYVPLKGQLVCHVEDVKGTKTKEYMIKKKLFLYKYPEVHFYEM